MQTNQNIIFFRTQSLIFLLLFTFPSIGQNSIISNQEINTEKELLIAELPTFNKKRLFPNSFVINPINHSKVVSLKEDFKIRIKSMKFKKKDTSTVSIRVAEPKSKIKEIPVKKGTEFPSSTYFEIPEHTEIVLTSDHGQETTLEAGSKSSSVITESSENHCTWYGKLWHRILNPVISYDTCGGGKKRTASARGTVFMVEVTSDSILIERESGIVAVQDRNEVSLNEDLTIDIISKEKRKLFVTNRALLNSKDTISKASYEGKAVMQLDSVNEIDKFFKRQLMLSKKILKKSGLNSNLGFKYLDRGVIDKGMDAYKEAISKGEIDRSVFIESALLMVEAYYKADKLKNRSTWLDAALKFIKIEHEADSIQYYHFKEIGAIEAANSLKNDFSVSTEYYAWAYTVKLKLEGCLEDSSQNPLFWRKIAKKLENEKID